MLCSAGLADTASGVGFGDSNQPSMDSGLVTQIAVAESVGERCLLVKHDETVHKEEKGKSEKHKRRGRDE